MPITDHEPVVSQDVLIEEMQAILAFLLDQAKGGNRMRLSDARSSLTSQLTLDFADYFKFLKRYNYVMINRSDHGLAVTEEGRALVGSELPEPFLKEIEQHFGSQVSDGEELIEMEDEAFDMEEPGSKVTPEPVAESTPPKRRPAPAREEVVSRQPKGAKFDSKYTRYDSLGSGGIGTVYRGRLNSLALDVAIKEIKELFTYFNFLQRSEVIRHLKDVVGQMAMLQHPLIIKIIDQNVEVAHPYFVMEYLPGGNLKALMAGGQLPIERSLILFTQVCYALETAHAADVVHGNLKPENILIDGQGNARVTDFGIGRLLHTDTLQSVPRVVTGSLGYLSPEQMSDASTFSVESDIYSLGILLYEMLTGNLPGRRSPLPSEVNKEVPKAIDDLFDRMTRDQPSERYPDLAALLDGFYKAVNNQRYLAKGQVVLFSESSRAAGAEKPEDKASATSPKKKG